VTLVLGKLKNKHPPPGGGSSTYDKRGRRSSGESSPIIKYQGTRYVPTPRYEFLVALGDVTQTQEGGHAPFEDATTRLLNSFHIMLRMALGSATPQ
jgi:hypothetical protein